VLKKLLVLALILCVSFFQGCELTESERAVKEAKEIKKDYANLISSHKDELINIFNWINKSDGYFYMYITKDGPHFDKSNGKEYQVDNENIQALITIMKDHGIGEISKDQLSDQIIMEVMTVKNGEYFFHCLVYTQKSLYTGPDGYYDKIADDFYYRFYVGE
jgi:hypothetical protein